MTMENVTYHKILLPSNIHIPAHVLQVVTNVILILTPNGQRQNKKLGVTIIQWWTDNGCSVRISFLC